MRSELAATLIQKLDDLVSGWPKAHGRYLEAYRKFCITPGNTVAAYQTMAGDSDSRTGEALSIGDDFSLNVRFDGSDSITSLKSGEVSVRGLYGYT